MSVRKRKWTSAKGPQEAWVVDYVDQGGHRHLKTFAHKKEAVAFSATTSVEVREGTHTAASASVTVAEAAREWLRTADETGLERATRDQYRQHVDHHIAPFLGRVKLSQLSVPTVREFESRLRSEGRSEAMVRKVVGSLGSLISDAQERGRISRNVVREMKGRRKPGKEKRLDRRKRGKLKIGVDIPTREEIRGIAENVAGRWRPIILTAIFTGLRASELRGLRWADVDFDKREIRVHQRADRYNEIGRPKSEAGERSVPMPPMVVNTLREWQLACPRPLTGETDEDGDALREAARPDHLVFPNGVGKVESLANIINRGLIPPQLAAGVSVPKLGPADEPLKDKEGGPVLAAKYTGMHALRHFYASWSINRRADGGLELPPKVVQERLGHSSITMTMDVYGHLFPRGDDHAELEAAERSLLGLSAT